MLFLICNTTYDIQFQHWINQLNPFLSIYLLSVSLSVSVRIQDIEMVVSPRRKLLWYKNVKKAAFGLMKIEFMIVASIGTNPTLKVKKGTMEYVLTMPKRLHFFRSTFSLFNYIHDKVTNWVNTMCVPQNVDIYGFVKSWRKKVKSFC